MLTDGQPLRVMPVEDEMTLRQSAEDFHEGFGAAVIEGMDRGETVVIHDLNLELPGWHKISGTVRSRLGRRTDLHIIRFKNGDETVEI